MIADPFGALLRGERVSWNTLGMSVEQFLDFCREAEIDGLAFEALATAGIDWPEAVASELGTRVRAGAGVELVRAREARGVLDALAAADVRALVFKGTALAYSVYSQPAFRPRNDTDLLVRPADAQAARETLESLGYIATNYSDGQVLFRQFELQRRDQFGLTHAVDIHWALSTQAVFADQFGFEELEAGAVPIPSLGEHARGLGLTDALLVACVHPAMHHRNEERLIWLYDIHLVASRLTDPDWGRFAGAATGKSMGGVCLHWLTRAAERLDTPFPADVRGRLTAASARGEPSARYLEPGRRWGDELAASLVALTWRDRLRLLREVAFPAPRYMLAAYGMAGVPLGGILLPALYAHRGARGAWKVLTGRK